MAGPPPGAVRYASTLPRPPHLTQANTSKSDVLLGNSARPTASTLGKYKLISKPFPALTTSWFGVSFRKGIQTFDGVGETPPFAAGDVEGCCAGSRSGP